MKFYFNSLLIFWSELGNRGITVGRTEIAKIQRVSIKCSFLMSLYLSQYNPCRQLY